MTEVRTERLGAELNAAIEFFDRSTGSLTEEDSTYTSVDGVFSTAQQVAHAAQTIDWFIDGAFDPNGFDLDFEAHERKVRGVTSLADARAWLARLTPRTLPSRKRREPPGVRRTTRGRRECSNRSCVWP